MDGSTFFRFHAYVEPAVSDQSPLNTEGFSAVDTIRFRQIVKHSQWSVNLDRVKRQSCLARFHDDFCSCPALCCPPSSPFPQGHALAISTIVAAAAAPRFSNETDRLALLRFKDEIIGDPFGSLTSWNHTLRFCDWQGVTCGGRLHPQRVTVLNLRGYNLVARRISPHMANLTFLRRINLSNNTFHGVSPGDIGCLFRLPYLFQENNTLNGEIPVNLTHCSELLTLDVYGNKL
ncbi:hypothetical protein ACLOJK_022595 [Asimina triloba]